MHRISQEARVSLPVFLLLAAFAGSAAASGPLLKIVNGLHTHAYPAVGNLVEAPNDQEVCTGTLIGCQTFLTAAHCVCLGTGTQCNNGNQVTAPEDLAIFFQHGLVAGVESVHVHPDFEHEPGADIAVLRLSTPVNGIAPERYNNVESPAFGTAGTVVGFGVTADDNDDAGIKRYGGIVTADCENGDETNEGHVCWDLLDPLGAPGEDSSNCYGDSGGPLFIDFDGDAQGPVLAGVTMGGGPTCLPPAHAVDTDVYAKRAWIVAQAGGDDLSANQCGVLPSAGNAEAPIQGFEGNNTGAYNFEVPAGATVLRVALNGQERDTPNDFDLYVKAGTPASSNNWDCRSRRPGSVEACEISSPVAGTWYLQAFLDNGPGGIHQVTVTVFGVGSDEIFRDGFESGDLSNWTP